jgi:hypothetical protein
MRPEAIEEAPTSGTASEGCQTAVQIYRQQRHRMNLPDAPIAHEGFFATHFFTV